MVPSPSHPPAGLTSGKEPWLYTMSSDVLPQPPSPTITIFSSFLPGRGAAVRAGAPGVSIARSQLHWRLRASHSQAERSLRGRGCRAELRRPRPRASATSARQPPEPTSGWFPFYWVPTLGRFQFPGKLRQLRNGVLARTRSSHSHPGASRRAPSGQGWIVSTLHYQHP